MTGEKVAEAGPGRTLRGEDARGAVLKTPRFRNLSRPASSVHLSLPTSQTQSVERQNTPSAHGATHPTSPALLPRLVGGGWVVGRQPRPSAKASSPGFQQTPHPPRYRPAATNAPRLALHHTIAMLQTGVALRPFPVSLPTPP